MTEQRLALIGAELETRLAADCKQLTSKLLCYRNWADCLAALDEARPAVILGTLPSDAVLEHALCQRLSENRMPALILLAPIELLDRALHLFQLGAFEYLPMQAEPEQIVTTVARALQRAQIPEPPSLSAQGVAGPLIGESYAMRELQRALQQLGKVRVPVLVRGESGTGKQMFAKLLHEKNAAGPFIVVNVGALARFSLDTELFGLERMQGGRSEVLRVGRVEEANGGTLFLDEVADLPLDAQLRLAQLLSDGQFHRVGGYAVCQSAVRIIASTRHSLETLVRNGQFEPDLYHRLTVVQVQLPRLQERREDIPLLANHFLAQAAAEIGGETKQLAPEVMPILQQYDWPGNVRQLENLCRRLAVMLPDPVIEPNHLPLEMRPELLIANEARSWEEGLKSWAEQALASGHRDLLDVAQPVLERILLQAALKHTGGLKQEAALLLGWGRNTLTRKLRELAIETDEDDEAA